MRQIILDTETTGLDYSKGHRLTEIGCLEMKNRRLTGRKFHSYINPERDIDPGAVNISGITFEFLQDKPKFFEIVDPFIKFLKEEKTELIIHNAPFDLGFLNHELSLVNHTFQPLENHLGVIDTLIMARRLHPGQRNNLDALCRRYNVDNSHREFHGALLDAELLAKVYLLMTTGQTSMSLSMEQSLDPNSSMLQNSSISLGTNTSNRETAAKFNIQKIIRNPAVPLKVIQASSEECRIHELRLAKLQKEKETI